MVPARRTLTALCVVALVLVAGCSGGGQLAGGDGAPAGQPGDGELSAEDGATERAQEEAGSKEAGDSPQARQRAVVRTGHVELTVEAFDPARRNLTRTVERYGGFVSDASLEVNRVDNATYKTGTLVLRVPRENFSAMMADAQAVGRVESTNVDSEDVTDRLVDLEARLKNLRVQRERLRGLYRNASDTEDVLAVERRLSEVQGEIERLEAERESLERRVALSTVRVDLREPRPDPGPVDVEQWYDTPVVAAFLDSVGGVTTTLRALVVAGAYALPYLLVFGLPVGGVAYAVRRRREGPADPTESDADDDQ